MYCFLFFISCSFFGFLGLSAFALLAFFVKLSGLFARSGGHFKDSVLSIFAVLHVPRGNTGALSSVDFLFGFALLVVRIFSWHVSEPSVVEMIGTVSIVPVDLLELRAETFLGFGRREQGLQLLDGFADLLLVAGVVSEGDAELSTHFPERLDREVAVFVNSSCWPAER
jgi:hypothetical protein